MRVKEFDNFVLLFMGGVDGHQNLENSKLSPTIFSTLLGARYAKTEIKIRPKMETDPWAFHGMVESHR
jgi:hypothetical protein